jgi:hypothetical protein
MRYLVLARKEYVEALAYRGTLEVTGSQDAVRLAQERFGPDWLELVLAPAPAVYWVVGPTAGIEATA